jgi:limonene-1,2-epoxide hydrolase
MDTVAAETLAKKRWSPEMSQARTPEIEIVRQFLKALEAKDLDQALTYVSDDVEYQNMPLPAVRGRKGIRRVVGPAMKSSGFEARINKVAANGTTVLTERTDAILVGPVRIPFQVCGTFEVKDDRIVVWRDTFDWTSALVNTVIAGPLYLFRRVGMIVGMKAAMRKAAKDAARAAG